MADAKQVLHRLAVVEAKLAEVAAGVLTAKGDVQVWAGGVATRLAVGADGQVLTADSDVLPGVSWATVTVASGDVDHDLTQNFVAAEHIDHSAVTITAGVGLTGGGDISAGRTLDLDIDGLTSESTVDGAADWIPFYDATAGAIRKLNPDDLPSGAAGVSACLGFSGATATISKGATEYVGIGSGHVQTAEANAEFYVPEGVAGTLKNLRTYVSKNDTGAAGNTVTIRKNGAGSGVVTTYGSGVTGLLTDLVNTVVVAAGDRLAIEVVNTGSGGGTKDIDLESVSFEIAA